MSKKKKKSKRKPFSGQRITPLFSTLTQRVEDKKRYNRKKDKSIKNEELS